MENEKILIGQIVKPQGIKGEVKIKSYSVSLEDLKNEMSVFVGDEQEKYTLTNFSVRQGFLYAKFAEVPSISEAERLRNKPVYLNKSDIRHLEDDEFLIEAERSGHEDWIKELRFAPCMSADAQCCIDCPIWSYCHEH